MVVHLSIHERLQQRWASSPTLQLCRSPPPQPAQYTSGTPPNQSAQSPPPQPSSPDPRTPHSDKNSVPSCPKPSPRRPTRTPTQQVFPKRGGQPRRQESPTRLLPGKGPETQPPLQHYPSGPGVFPPQPKATTRGTIGRELRTNPPPSTHNSPARIPTGAQPRYRLRGFAMQPIATNPSNNQPTHHFHSGSLHVARCPAWPSATQKQTQTIGGVGTGSTLPRNIRPSATIPGVPEKPFARSYPPRSLLANVLGRPPTPPTPSVPRRLRMRRGLSAILHRARPPTLLNSAPFAASSRNYGVRAPLAA